MHRNACVCVCVLPPPLFLPAEWSSWLPLYGNLCCKLVAQPACMTDSTMCGYLSQKVLLATTQHSSQNRAPVLYFGYFFLSLFQSSVEGIEHWCRLYCVLSAGVLCCYFTPEEIEAKVPPTLRVAIDKVWTASKSHTMVEWLNRSLGAFSIKWSLKG